MVIFLKADKDIGLTQHRAMSVLEQEGQGYHPSGGLHSSLSLCLSQAVLVPCVDGWSKRLYETNPDQYHAHPIILGYQHED